MTSITFDTLKFVEKLKSAGIAEAHAKAEALVTAFSEAVATRSDINRLERELLLVKWMVGLVLGGVVALIMRTFFPA